MTQQFYPDFQVCFYGPFFNRISYRNALYYIIIPP